MNILKEVFKSQVYPAMGCTEPACVALCGARAAQILGGPPESALFLLDRGTYKNGMGVTLPNTGGERGNLLAAAVGVLVADPSLEMKVLSKATPDLVARAKRLVEAKAVRLECLPDKRGLFVEARLRRGRLGSACRIEGTHTNFVFASRNGRKVFGSRGRRACAPPSTRGSWRRRPCGT
jgi:L-cysteine desulfidase